MKKLYLDSDVILAYLKQEKMHHREVFTNQIINELLSEDVVFVFSELNVLEIMNKTGMLREEIMDMLTLLSKNSEFVKLNNEVRELAHEMQKKGVHYPDCIHAAFIKSTGAVLVTYNYRDYESVKEVIIIKTPQTYFL